MFTACYIVSMKLVFSYKIPLPERQLLKRCGYDQQVSPRTQQISYVRLFGRTGYPRFHCYVYVRGDEFEINLHLDQKAPTYGTHTAHSGEYEGAIVETEGNRIRHVVSSLCSSLPSSSGSHDPFTPTMRFG